MTINCMLFALSIIFSLGLFILFPFFFVFPPALANKLLLILFVNVSCKLLGAETVALFFCIGNALQKCCTTNEANNHG